MSDDTVRVARRLVAEVAGVAAAATDPLADFVARQRELADLMARWAELQHELADQVTEWAELQRAFVATVDTVLAPIDSVARVGSRLLHDLAGDSEPTGR